LPKRSSDGGARLLVDPPFCSQSKLCRKDKVKRPVHLIDLDGMPLGLPLRFVVVNLAMMLVVFSNPNADI
jgi:hypothetical protein